MFRKRKLFIALVLVISSQGCGLLQKSSGDAEITFPKTDVGTPNGPAMTKSIGPAGGSIASPDGRITVKVPPNEVPVAIEFSIQPITNQAQGGLGNAYRLEPNGQKFAMPAEVTFKYDDHDLEGTAPEFLEVAYQDEQKVWQSLKTTKIDSAGKTFTVSTTHFTDMSFLKKMHLSPQTATVRVGETIGIELIGCKKKISFLTQQQCVFGDPSGSDYSEARKGNWYTDIGTINDPGALRILYTAPAKKPTPNVATVSFPYDLQNYHPDKEVWVWGWRVWGNETTWERGIFTAHITIIDRGYKVSGQSHDEVYSGVICDLEKPFTVKGLGLAELAYEFVPSSPTSGAVSYTTSYKPGGAKANESGKGTYIVEGIDTDKPRIVLKLSGTGTITVGPITLPVSGAGDVNLNLTPLTGNECGGG